MKLTKQNIEDIVKTLTDRNITPMFSGGKYYYWIEVPKPEASAMFSGKTTKARKT